MNKHVVMAGAVVGMTLGAFLPILWGDKELISVTSIMCSMVGGFIGIWLSIVLSRRFG